MLRTFAAVKSRQVTSASAGTAIVYVPLRGRPAGTWWCYGAGAAPFSSARRTAVQNVPAETGFM